MPPRELPGDPVLLENCEPQRSLNGDPGSVEVLEDNGLQFLELPRGFRPRRRWLITELEGLSWEAKTRVAGHLSGGKVKGEGGHTDKKKHILKTKVCHIQIKSKHQRCLNI